jgi:hypothetical protein
MRRARSWRQRAPLSGGALAFLPNPYFAVRGRCLGLARLLLPHCLGFLAAPTCPCLHAACCSACSAARARGKCVRECAARLARARGCVCGARRVSRRGVGGASWWRVVLRACVRCVCDSSCCMHIMMLMYDVSVSCVVHGGLSGRRRCSATRRPTGHWPLGGGRLLFVFLYGHCVTGEAGWAIDAAARLLRAVQYFFILGF